MASILWSLASLCRSNGLIFIGFPIYAIYKAALNNRFSASTVLSSLLQSIIIASGFAAFQYHAFVQFCTQGSQRPWCSNSIPLIYSFVQSHYWNNGFLKYFTVEQIPNFLLAAPMILISIAGISYYLISKGRSLLNDRLLPYYTMWSVLAFSCVTSFHVQIITRFLSFLPPLYWTIAQFYSSFSPKWRFCLLFYIVCYQLIGSILFTLFYPPA